VPFKRTNYSLLEDAANEFIHHFSQNFLLLHSEQDQKIEMQQKSKKTGSSAAAKEKQKQEQ